MDAPEINPEDETAKKNYFDNIFVRHKPITEFMGEDLSRFGRISDGRSTGTYPRQVERGKDMPGEQL